MNQDQLAHSYAMLRHFIDDSLGISQDSRKIMGFRYARELLEAAAYNTYLETNSDKTDSLYKLIKAALPEMATHSYLESLKRMDKRVQLSSQKVMLAFDYTDEDFYGEVQGFDIFGWTKENSVTGKFKFLTCSVVTGQFRLPLVSIPVHIGHNMAQAVTHCLYLIKNLIGEIELILFDRGFYAKELLYELDKLGLRYLVLISKNSLVKRELQDMESGDTKITSHSFDFIKDFDKKEGETTLAFLKGVFNKNLNKEIDWAFATNCEEPELDNIIETYKKRWQIEINFRVQDDATIKCKSSEMKIRYFLFVFQQLLQAQWICFYKEVPFKKFIIEYFKVGDDLVAHAKY